MLKFNLLLSTFLLITNVSADCTCTISGDPHIRNFEGGAEDYGGGWTNMVKSADCVFNVQTEAAGAKTLNDRTAVRIGLESVLIDHRLGTHDKALVNSTVDPKSDTKVTWAENKFSIENKVIGVRVEVTITQRTVAVKYLDGESTIASTSGGYCKACNRVAGDTCGQDTVVDWPVAEGQDIWSHTLAKTQPKCDAYQCAYSPLADAPPTGSLVGPTTVAPAPTTAPPTACQRRLRTARKRKLQVVHEITLDTCDVAESSCSSDTIDDLWGKAISFCRGVVESHWWSVDCNCVRDICTMQEVPEVADVPEAPCQEPKMNTANIVSHSDGYQYATLDFANPALPSTANQCHWMGQAGDASDKPKAKVPIGWELCPGNNADVSAMFTANAFGVKCLVAAGGTYGTNCEHVKDETINVDYHTCSTVSHCSARVCIRRKVHASDQCAAQSWSAGTKTIAETVYSGLIENFLQTTVLTSVNGDNTVVALARNEDTQQVHLCVGSASTDSVVASEIKTLPAYGVSWYGHTQAMNPAGGKDTFLPVIHGNNMSSTVRFSAEASNTRGFCIGPLVLAENMCVDGTISSNTNHEINFLNSDVAATKFTQFTLCPVC